MVLGEKNREAAVQKLEMYLGILEYVLIPSKMPLLEFIHEKAFRYISEIRFETFEKVSPDMTLV